MCTKTRRAAYLPNIARMHEQSGFDLEYGRHDNVVTFGYASCTYLTLDFDQHNSFRFVPSRCQDQTLARASVVALLLDVVLMLLHLRPQIGVLLNLHFLASVQLIVAAQIHVFVQQRDYVLVEGLPIWILQMISVPALAATFEG